MTCSPNKRVRLLPALLTGLMGLTAGHAVAQEADTTQISQVSGEKSGITMGALAQVDPSSVGLIDQTSGGFSQDMWARSDRSLIERLIPQLPTASRSPASQKLLHRLLLTAAVVPAGEAGTPSLLALRLERLARTGDLPDTLELMSRLPQDGGDSEISGLKVNAALLGGDEATACTETANIVQTDANPYWVMVQGYCHVLQGNMTAAAMTIEMLQEKRVAAPLYYQLMARLTAPDTAKKLPLDLSTFSNPDPLLISMIKKAGLEIPVAVLAKASPLMLQALASGADLPLELRLPAADQAARLGAISPEKLAEIYGAVSFTPAEREKGVTTGTARMNALLYQAAAAAPDIKVRGPILQAIWARSKKLDMLPLQARANVLTLMSIEPSTEALPYIREITRLLLLAGQYERVGQWVDFIRTQAETDEAATKAMLALWPLMTIADSQKSSLWSADRLDQWWKSQPAADRQDRATLLFTVLEVLGYQIPEAAWSQLMEGVVVKPTVQPALPYWRALKIASRDKRLGETVLVSLIILGDAGLDKMSPLMAGHVIGSLCAVDLGSTGREIAIEALVARGF